MSNAAPAAKLQEDNSTKRRLCQCFSESYEDGQYWRDYPLNKHSNSDKPWMARWKNCISQFEKQKLWKQDRWLRYQTTLAPKSYLWKHRPKGINQASDIWEQFSIHFDFRFQFSMFFLLSRLGERWEWDTSVIAVRSGSFKRGFHQIKKVFVILEDTGPCFHLFSTCFQSLISISSSSLILGFDICNFRKA